MDLDFSTIKTKELCLERLAKIFGKDNLRIDEMRQLKRPVCLISKAALGNTGETTIDILNYINLNTKRMHAGPLAIPMGDQDYPLAIPLDRLTSEALAALNTIHKDDIDAIIAKSFDHKKFQDELHLTRQELESVLADGDKTVPDITKKILDQMQRHTNMHQTLLELNHAISPDKACVILEQATGVHWREVGDYYVTQDHIPDINNARNRLQLIIEKAGFDNTADPKRYEEKDSIHISSNLITGVAVGYLMQANGDLKKAFSKQPDIAAGIS